MTKERRLMFNVDVDTIKITQDLQAVRRESAKRDCAWMGKEHIFVFGSNRQGRHGKGAANYAMRHYGAKMGVGEGYQGMSYAIPTKETPYETLTLPEIKNHVDAFLVFASFNKEKTFLLTPIGTGLAGYTVDEIRPLFSNAPKNVIFLETWGKR